MDVILKTLIFTSLLCAIGTSAYKPSLLEQKLSLKTPTTKIPALPSTSTWSPPDISQARYIIKNDICQMNENDEPITVVFMIISHVGNRKSRNEIRSVYSAEKMRKLGIRRVFMLGSLKNATELDSQYPSVPQSDIEKENEINNDIVQFNVIESYERLGVKSVLALYWASKNCQSATFAMKMDDDLLVSYYGVLAALTSIKDEAKDSLIGNMYKDFSMPVLRDDGTSSKLYEKYFMTHEEYSDDFYPPYLSGMLYATSPKTAGTLAKTSREVNLFRMEDIYITGMVAAKANINLTDIGRVVSEDTSLYCCRNDIENVMYHCKFIVAFGPKINQRSTQKRINDHEEYCFVNKNCSKWNEDLIENTNVLCF